MARYRENASVIRGRLPVRDAGGGSPLALMRQEAASPSTSARDLSRLFNAATAAYKTAKEGQSRAVVDRLYKELLGVWKAIILNPNLNLNDLAAWCEVPMFADSGNPERGHLPLFVVDNPSFPILAMTGEVPAGLVESLAYQVRAELQEYPVTEWALQIGAKASKAYCGEQAASAILAYVGWSDKQRGSLPRIDPTLVMELSKLVPAHARMELSRTGYWPQGITPNRRRR